MRPDSSKLVTDKIDRFIQLLEIRQPANHELLVNQLEYHKLRWQHMSPAERVQTMRWCNAEWKETLDATRP